MQKIENDRVNFLSLIDLLKIRAQTIDEIIENSEFYFNEPEIYEEKGVKKFFKNDHSIEFLKNLHSTLNNIKDFGAENTEKVIRNLADSLDVKAGTLIHPLRLALTGKTTSPGIFDVIFTSCKGASVPVNDKKVERFPLFTITTSTLVLCSSILFTRLSRFPCSHPIINVKLTSTVTTP